MKRICIQSALTTGLVLGGLSTNPILAKGLLEQCKKGAVDCAAVSFRMAKSPSIAQLVGKSFDCMEIGVKGVDFTQPRLKNYAFSQAKEGIQNSGSDSVKSFTRIGKVGLQGISGGILSVVRIDANGDLIVEKSILPQEAQDSTAVVSRVDPDRDVLNYLVCSEVMPSGKPGSGQSASVSPPTGECGEDPTMDIEQRIEDCHTVKTSDGSVWALVTRIESRGEMKEVWQTPDQVLVSDTLDGEYAFGDARKTCSDPMQQDALGNISGNWQLPTAYYDGGKNRDNRGYNPHNEDRLSYNHLEALGIREIVPNMNHWFWSSSSDGADSGRCFSGYDGYVDVGLQCNRISIRCVLGR